jgi:DNA-binding NtrC family response regulator
MMKNYGTILVVDDNSAILTAARICLGSVFEKVITLASPDGILATMNQESVDIVLQGMNFTLAERPMPSYHTTFVIAP